MDRKKIGPQILRWNITAHIQKILVVMHKKDFFLANMIRNFIILELLIYRIRPYLLLKEEKVALYFLLLSYTFPQ